MPTFRTSIIALSAFGAVIGCASGSRSAPKTIVSAAPAAPGAMGASGTARAAIMSVNTTGAVAEIIRHQMDQQAHELMQNIPDARVERVGEGILVTFSTGLLFQFDGDRVLGESERNLRTLARSLDKYQGTNLLIVGHTDSLGTSAYNHDLSLRRARATAAYLTSQGVALDRMKSDGRGEQEPLGDNRTEAGQALSRRVEVAIFASDRYRAQLTEKSAKKG